MQLLPAPLQALAAEFDRLPGIGPKAAERLARRLVLNPARGEALNVALETVLNQIDLCPQCRCYRLQQQCPACEPGRLRQPDGTMLLVFEQLQECQLVLEAGWQAPVFVLHGLLSPLDRVGPLQLGLDCLQAQLESSEHLVEVVLVLDDSVEARTTAHYLDTLVRRAGLCCRTEALPTWLEQFRQGGDGKEIE